MRQRAHAGSAQEKEGQADEDEGARFHERKHGGFRLTPHRPRACSLPPGRHHGSGNTDSHSQQAEDHIRASPAVMPDERLRQRRHEPSPQADAGKRQADRQTELAMEEPHQHA